MSNEELYNKIRIHVETTEECLDNFNVPTYVRELMQQDLELFVLVMKHLEDKGGNNG
jgi:hypothetical protein